MQECITFWLDSYAGGYFIRFSIIDLSTQKAVGTIECFAKPESFEKFGKVAVLRLDVASAYENTFSLLEIMELIDSHFYECFAVDTIVTKAVQLAQARTRILCDTGYTKLDPNPIMPYPDYYAKIKTNH